MRGDLVTIDDLETLVPSLIAAGIAELQSRPTTAGGLQVSTLTVDSVGTGTVEGLFDEDDPTAEPSTVYGFADPGERVKVLMTPSGGSFVIGTGTPSGTVGTVGGPFLPLIGGTLTGPLILAGDPVADLGAATKQYVDATHATPSVLERATSFPERAANIALARRGATPAVEVLLCDSLDSSNMTSAENTAFSAVYEKIMAHGYNNGFERAAGYLCVNMRNADDATAIGVQWDTVNGTWVKRGPSYSARSLASTQFCEVTRAGTGVTIFYTKSKTVTGTLTVTINGVTAGTINTFDAALATAFDAGYSAYFANPAGYTSMDIVVTCTAGTSQLDGGYIHNGNDTSLYRLLRWTRPGWSMCHHLVGATAANYYRDGTYPDALMGIHNQQPEIVTIVLGTNDVNPANTLLTGGTVVLGGVTITGALTATQYATAMTTLIAAIRAQYQTPLVGTITGTTTLTITSGRALTAADTGSSITGAGIPANTTITFVDATHATLSAASTNAAGVSVIVKAAYPSIRFVYEHKNRVNSATGGWLTTYRDAAKSACVSGSVAFIDLAEALGETGPTDEFDVTDDGVHLHDDANLVLGELLAQSTIPYSVNIGTQLRLDGTFANIQKATAAGGDIGIYVDAIAPTLHLGLAQIAPVAGTHLGVIAFDGLTAAGAIRSVVGIRATTDGSTWTSTSAPSRLELSTTAVGDVVGTIRLFIDNAGKTWFGQSSALAQSWIDVTGNASFAGDVNITGTLTAGTFTIGSLSSPFIIQASAAQANIFVQRYGDAGGTANNTTVGSYVFRASYDTTVAHVQQIAQIYGVTDGTQTAGSAAGRIVFATTASGGTSATSRGGFDAVGRFFVGAATAAAATAYITAAGALILSSDVTVNTNKFTVDATTGNTVVAGTLTQTGVATFAANPTVSISAAQANLGLLRYGDGGGVPISTTIGALAWRGSFDGTAANFYPAASIAVVTDEAFSSGHGGARLIFATTLNGATTTSNRGGFDNAGIFFLGAGTVAAASTTITAAGLVALFVAAPATQTASYHLINIANTTAIATGTNASIAGVGVTLAPVLTYGIAAGSTIVGWTGFSHQPTHQNSGAARLTGIYYDFWAQPTFKTNDNTNPQTVTTIEMFRADPTLTPGGSTGTLTVTTLRQFAAAPVTVPANSTITALNQVNVAGPAVAGTVTTRRGVFIGDGSGAGTFTTNIGIDIAALAAGASNIGIRSAAPLALTPQAYACGNATSALNNNIAITSSVLIITGPTAGFTISGFAAGFDGQILLVICNVAQAMTIGNANGGSTAANQIVTKTGADVTTTANSGATAWFVYNVTNTRWELMGTQG